MKTIIMALAILAATPAAVQAKSAYAACLATEQSMQRIFPGLGMDRSRSFGGVDRSYYWVSSSSYYDTYYVAPVYTSNISSASTWAEHNRVMGFVRACRHLRQVEPPAFRVVGVKSPAQRNTVNSPDRSAGPR